MNHPELVQSHAHQTESINVRVQCSIVLIRSSYTPVLPYIYIILNLNLRFRIKNEIRLDFRLHILILCLMRNEMAKTLVLPKSLIII